MSEMITVCNVISLAPISAPDEHLPQAVIKEEPHLEIPQEIAVPASPARSASPDIAN